MGYFNHNLRFGGPMKTVPAISRFKIHTVADSYYSFKLHDVGRRFIYNISLDFKVRAQSRDKQVEDRMLSHRQDDNNRHATRHQVISTNFIYIIQVCPGLKNPTGDLLKLFTFFLKNCHIAHTTAMLI